MSEDLMKVHCDKCKAQWLLKESVIKELVVKKNFKEYLITYCECPECKACYMIMVCDEQSLKTKEEFMREAGKIRMLTQQRKAPSKTLIKRASDLNAKFKRQTTKLSFEFPKTFTSFDELKLDNPYKMVTESTKSDERG